MERVKYTLTAVGLALLLAGPAKAIEPEETGECKKPSGEEQLKARAQERQQEPLYGEALMSKKERVTMRKRLHEADNDQERARLRAEHRELIQKRAHEQGVELPATLERPWPRKMDPDCEEAGEPLLRRKMPEQPKGKAGGNKQGIG